MNVKVCRALAVLLLAAADFAAAAGPARREVRVCSDPWMPYYGDGTRGSPEGFAAEVTREALKGAGVELRFVVAPWSRCLADVKAGRWDGIACVQARELADAVYPAEPVLTTYPVAVTGPGSTWIYEGPASLATVRLGVVQNYWYTDEVEAWVEAHRDDGRVFVSTGTDPLRRLLDMLEAGRVDVVIENPDVLAWALRRTGRAQGALRRAGVIRGRLPLFVAFSLARPDSRRLARAFDEGVRAMRADGRLLAIARRYEIEPWWIPAPAKPRG